jgi:hypothetical protein
MIVIAVIASVAALAIAVVALVRLIYETRARAIIVTARIDHGSGAPRLTVEVVNTSASILTVQAIWFWVSVDKKHETPAEPGSLHDWEDLWDLTGSEVALAAELDAGIWKAWSIDLEPDSPVTSPGARAYVTAYLKPFGTATALVRI